MYCLGIDPGGTTGYAWVRLVGTDLVLIEAGAVSDNGFYDWLDSWADKALQLPKDADERIFVACEDFIKRPDKGNQEWLELPVAKQIGAAQYRAYQLNWRCIIQQPSCKPMGYKLAGLPYTPGKAGTHIADAQAHAAFFLRNGIPTTPTSTAKKEQLRKSQYATRRKYSK